MALSVQQKFSNQFSNKVNPPSFFDRTVKDIADTGRGFVPGLMEIGRAATNDAFAPLTGNSFKLDDVAKQSYSAFRNDSFLPALATGQLSEAWNRFSARPFSGLLDASLAFPAHDAITRIGSSVGSTASRGNFASMGGYSKLAPDSAQSVRGALEGIAGDSPNMFGSLPATLDFDGGINLPTRNFFGQGNQQLKTIGDDIWARPVNRSITPAVKDENVLSDLHVQSLNNPTDDSGIAKSLDDDLSQKIVNPRADNELIAKIGDAISPAFSKAFPGIVSARWGRRLAKHETRRGLMTGDQANHAHGQAITELDPTLQQLAPDLTDEERYHALGLATFADSHGYAPDEMASVRDNYAADSLPIPEMLDDEMLGLPQYEFMRKTNTAFLPYSRDEAGKFTYDDVLSHPEAGLSPRELMEKHGQDIANKYSYESISPAMKQAWDQHAKDRQDLYLQVEMALETSARNGQEWIIKTPQGIRPYTLEDLYENPDSLDDIVSVNKLAPNVGDADTSSFRSNEVQSAKKRYNDSLHKTRSLNDRTSAQLGMLDAMRGQVTRMDDGVHNPGIVDVIDEISNNKLVSDIHGSDGYKKFAEYRNELNARSKDIEYERLDSNRLDHERADFNTNRLRRWMGDEEGTGSFFPMRYNRKINEDQVNIDSSPDFKRSDEVGEPGSPFDVYLSGKMDVDPSVHVRNFKRQNDLLTHDRLVDTIRKMAVEINPEEHKNHYTKESDFGSRKSSRSYIMLEHDGPLDKDIQRLRSDLEAMSYDIRSSGGPDLAAMLLDTVDELDITRNGDHKNLGIPTESYIAIKKEIGNGVKSLEAFYDKYRLVGDWWKFSVLHARFPSWFRNNWIGAQLMLAMSGGVKNMGGAYAKTLKTVNPENHEMMGNNFPEARSLGSAQQARGIRLMGMLKPGGRFEAQKEKLLHGLNKLSDVNADYADSPARLARTQQIFDERVQKLQQLGKDNGVEIEDTPELREKMINHEPTRHGIAQEMLRDMVDFSDLTRFERDWIIAIYPFYSWMKGSTKALGTLAADHPARIFGMEQIADLGERESVADAGAATPDFARSWYELPGNTWMSTGGMNPYETPLDLVNTALGFVPGGMSYRQFGSENILGSMNPMLSGGVASVLGKDPFFGTPMENDNPMDAFIKMQMNNPIIKTPGSFFANTGPDATTQKSPSLAFANMLGMPFVDPRWSAVHSRGSDEAVERYKTNAAIQWLNPPAVGIS